MSGFVSQAPGKLSGNQLPARRSATRITIIGLLVLLGIPAGLTLRHLFISRSSQPGPDSPWRLAEEALAAREYPQAVADFQKCLDLCPFNAEAHFRLAQSFRRLGQMKEWQKHLQEAVVLDWPRGQIELEQQLQRAQVGDLWAVEDVLIERLNSRPAQEVTILEALVNGLMTVDRLADVMQLTSTWIEMFPEDWLPRIYRGNARLRLNGKTEAVIDDFSRVLELKPNEVESHLSLAIVLANNGDVERALPHFQECTSQLPREPRVLFGTAFCQYTLGKSQEARATLQRLFATSPDHAAGCFLQAKIELAEGAPEQAYGWLIKADKLAPKEVDVTNALIQVCGQLGRTQAAQHYQRLLEEIRARDAELDRLATALKSRPEDTALRFQLGMTCMKLGRDAEATHWFQGILWKDPGHLPTLNALADFYEKKGNRRMADYYRRKAKSAGGEDVKTPEGSLRK
jgi:tetratricopeptide (TPR) repeat protein